MSTSPITWNTCPQYAEMQSWGSKQGGPRCRWTCSWVLKTMSSDILESHFNFFDLVPCIMFLTHLQLLLWKFYGSSTPLLNRNPCSLFLVLSTRFIIHVSCHHCPDFPTIFAMSYLKKVFLNSQIPVFTFTNSTSIQTFRWPGISIPTRNQMYGDLQHAYPYYLSC